jgi:hypothetical protein
VAVGRHVGKELSSDKKTHNCSGDEIGKQRRGRGEEGRKVWKGKGKTTKGGKIAIRRENKRTEKKEKEEKKQRNMKNKEQKEKGMKVKTKKGVK